MIRLDRLSGVEGRFEFRDTSRSLTVRGAHPEWVLQAAAEVISSFSRIEAECLVQELVAMHALGAVGQTELTQARIDFRQRFASLPSCFIRVGSVDYFWTLDKVPRLKPDRVPVLPLRLGPEMLVPPPSTAA